MMPVKPENKARYPANWEAIREQILERAGHRCEWCGIPNHVYRRNRDDTWTEDPLQADTWTTVDEEAVAYIVLTVAHLDHQPENNDPRNLRALCQRCHNRYDAPHRRRTALITRREKSRNLDLFRPSRKPVTTKRGCRHEGLDFRGRVHTGRFSAIRRSFRLHPLRP